MKYLIFDLFNDYYWNIVFLFCYNEAFYLNNGQDWTFERDVYLFLMFDCHFEFNL